MDPIQEMLGSHPQKPGRHFDVIAQVIRCCYECAQVCLSCADACLAEEKVADLRECIRLDLDCADICSATGRLVTRQARPDSELWRATLEACIQACRSCAAECARHEDRYEHCRICREACERCADACQQALSAYPEGGAEASH